MNNRTSGRGLPRHRPARSMLAATFGALAGLLLVAVNASASVRPATPSNLGSVLGSAQPGDTVELAAGNYGTFSGAVKPGPVTVRPQAGAAVTMSVRFAPAANIRLEGVTIGSAEVSGQSRNVTIAGSRFTGMAVVRADQMSNANILFDGNTHVGIDACGNCYEGRLQVASQGPGPSGVTVANSKFGPGGNADGMQIGANGVQVLNNEFTGLKQISATHTDALQLYGQSNTVVRGNYFHDNDVAIMAPDGGSNELITDNVFIGDGKYRPAVQLGTQTSSTFAHNTVKDLDVFFDAKDGGRPSTNGVVRDNVILNGSFNVPAAKCSNCTVAYNLFTGRPSGANALTGTPVFVGGANATTWAGFGLANGSAGKGNASDGTDRGIRLGGQPAAPVAPVAAPPAAGVLRVGIGLKLPKRITWGRLRRGLRVRLTVPQRMTVVLRLARTGSRRALVRRQRTIRAGTRTFVLRPRRLHHRPRKLVLRLQLTNRAGASITLRRTIRVVR